MEENFLKIRIEASFHLIDIKRLNKCDSLAGVVRYMSSRTVCIKFAGQKLSK